MFQSVDNTTLSGQTARQAWMALLARAPLGLLETIVAPLGDAAAHWLRRPETGLMMVQGRVGGSGERFNLGEITVTRCALRLATSTDSTPTVGVAWVLGRNHRHAELAALADACLQNPGLHADLETALLEPLRTHRTSASAQRRQQALSTRVDFFTVAREAGSPNSENKS
jgi:alpha-D-ribose 1-methylphosphonate 5-triphosphate synthase subunit PhnG